MTNATLPASIIKFPIFFTIPDKTMRVQFINITYGKGEFKTMLDFSNLTSESMLNYHNLWWTFNNRKKTMTLYCFSKATKYNCSDLTDYSLAITEHSFDRAVNPIKKDPSRGKVIEEEVSGPPCSKKTMIDKFKIGKICDLHQQIIQNKEPFLNLMKYTKQSPVYLTEDEEYQTDFKDANLTLQGFGYAWKKDKVN